jgi:hypothetical protein
MEIFKTNSDIEPETLESMIKKENKKSLIDEFFTKDSEKTTLEDLDHE